MSSEQEIFNFATIGEVFEDGVSLIFDGQDTATEKHYKVNTSVIFKAGDRVKILADSGTYVVEYVVGYPKPAEDEEDVVGIPAGGSTGKALVKASSTDFDVEWGNPSGILPAGGSAGQVLTKSSTVAYAAEWKTPSLDVDGTLPTGGSAGQCLVKNSATSYDASWKSPPGMLPTGGTNGQCLVKNGSTNYSAAWGTPAAATSVINQYRATTATYNLYFQTDASGNFYIRMGTSGTWKKITVT